MKDIHPSAFTFHTAGVREGVQVRVVEIEGEPWFVAKDVLAVLGMDVNQPQNYLARLASDEKQKATRKSYRNLFTGASRFAPNMTLISEPGLYKLIQSSSRPEAKEFDRWVRHEVLPSIRKTGGYIAGQEKVRSGEMSVTPTADVGIPSP